MGGTWHRRTGMTIFLTILISNLLWQIVNQFPHWFNNRRGV